MKATPRRAGHPRHPVPNGQQRMEGWHQPAAFMVRSAFVEPDSELGALRSMGL
jgi:hypothetical protein